MSIEYVNIGQAPNDGEGDPLRTAFSKINNNFAFLQQTSTDTTSSVTIGDEADQVIFEYPVNQFTQAIFQIKTYNEDNNNSQGISLSAQIHNNGNSVAYTAYNTTFVGSPLTRYNMDVEDGNVRILVSPLQNVILQHFISYQITYVGDLGVGANLTTESGFNLVTELGNVFITTEN